MSSFPQGWLDVFGGPKAKIGYLVSYIKLLLVNMNHLEFFFFFFKVYKHKKNLTKLFTFFDMVD